MRKEKKTRRISRVLKNRRSIAESLSALADAFLEESEPGMGTGLSAFLALAGMPTVGEWIVPAKGPSRRG